METLSLCPVCGKPDFSEFLHGKDFFLTQEEYQILVCNHCGVKFVNPRPGIYDIGRYYESPEYISHGGKNNLLHSFYRMVRMISVRRKFRLMQKVNSGKELLDIGCGTGEFLHYCSKQGYKVTGIEPGEKARNFAIATHHLDISEESYLAGLTTPRFDIITMWHVLEHVHKLNDRMKKINEILKPDGTLVVAVPNSDSWDAKHYNEFWAAYDLPRHLYHFSQSPMKLLAKNHNFILERIIPLKMDAFYICLLSEKYSTGKQNYFKAVINGIRSNNFAGRNNKNYSSLIYVLKKLKNEK